MTPNYFHRIHFYASIYGTNITTYICYMQHFLRHHENHDNQIATEFDYEIKKISRMMKGETRGREGSKKEVGRSMEAMARKSLKISPNTTRMACQITLDRRHHDLTIVELFDVV